MKEESISKNLVNIKMIDIDKKMSQFARKRTIQVKASIILKQTLGSKNTTI